MRKHWKCFLGILLAGSVLAGCGSQSGGAEPFTRGGEQGVAGDGGTVHSGMDASAGVLEPSRMQMTQEPVWDRQDTASYEALRLFSQQLMLENMEKENPLLSPVSAYLALGMVGMGARGDTLGEFQAVMGVNMPALSGELMERYLQEQEGMTLTVANSVWVDQQFEPDEKWVADMENIFRGKGYRGVLSSEEVMEQINTWCSDNTRGLIPTMLDEPLPEDARLALLNAIYFKGDWASPFDTANTAERPFTREDGTELQVDTMSKYSKSQSYLSSALGEGVVLPYQGEDFAYVAILPREGTTVRELYRQLTPEALAELLESESVELCDLRLPKYEISFDQKLNQSLQAMGLTRAFDGSEADLSGLGRTEQGDPPCINLVKQKAVFKVDEEGTEAAAVTLVSVKCTAMEVQQEPRELYFDRPFVYMILDVKTQVPLFVGIMDDPSK
ncbi:MAG: serpin family protein [bacterium]|nr:serpin family protein [bacterium]MCM1375833.1 serpin family protein [Muribaculum sp.]